MEFECGPYGSPSRYAVLRVRHRIYLHQEITRTVIDCADVWNNKGSEVDLAENRVLLLQVQVEPRNHGRCTPVREDRDFFLFRLSIHGTYIL